MTTIRGHYDGKVIVPSGLVDLPRGRELLLHIDDAGESQSAKGVSGEDLIRFAGVFSADDLRQMASAVAGGCEKANANE